jgi:hypothetical protein
LDRGYSVGGWPQGKLLEPAAEANSTKGMSALVSNEV